MAHILATELYTIEDGSTVFKTVSALLGILWQQVEGELLEGRMQLMIY